MGQHSQFCAGTCLTGDCFNFHSAVINFRHFCLKQTLYQIRMRPADNGIWAFVCFMYINHINFDVVPFLKHLIADHFAARQDCFAFTNFQSSSTGTGIHPFHNRADQFLMLGFKFLHHQPALTSADSLTDNTAGLMSGNTPKFSGMQLHTHLIANRTSWIDFTGFFQKDLTVWILYILHYIFTQVHLKFIFIRIQMH